MVMVRNDNGWIRIMVFKKLLFRIEASRETYATCGKRTCPRFGTASVGYRTQDLWI